MPIINNRQNKVVTDLLHRFKKLQGRVNSIDGNLPSWGNITGTLSNQTDLQNALSGKASLAHTHTKTDISDFTH